VPGVFAFAGCTQHLADEIQSLVICVDYEEFGSLRATIGCNEGTPWPTQAARFPPKPSVKIQLDCQDVSRLLSRAQDESLPAGERARLRLHLILCETCRNVDEQLQFIRRAMGRLGKDDAPPPG